MNPELRAQIAFHLTGKHADATLHAVEGGELRPALLAAYRDLASLRYDFPLVLLGQNAGEPFARSLSSIVDDLLRRIAPRGIEGERMRQSVMRVERAIRGAMSGAGTVRLAAAWNAAAAAIAQASAEAADDVERARAALDVDGELVDCDERMPARVMTHAWRVAQARKTAPIRAEVDALVRKLSDILEADAARSTTARAPQQLAASFGAPHRALFDFDAMSTLLSRTVVSDSDGEERRQRVERTRDTLLAHRHLVAPEQDEAALLFDNCDAALAAVHERMAKVVALAAAMSVAELDAEGRYVPGEHDAVIAALDSSAIGASDLASFADVLVCLDADRMPAGETDRLTDLLSSGLPVKVVVCIGDLLGPPAAAGAQIGTASRAMRLGSMAVGLNEAFVLQSGAASLHALRDRIAAGMEHAGPALFCVHGGVARSGESLPPYLQSAVAMQSRAFPCFVYDPAAAPELSSRFSLDGNPQVDADWPVEALTYENAERRRIVESTAFTFADFVACDPRYARHFARVERCHWTEAMKPFARWLSGRPESVPYVEMVDRDDRLHRVVVDGAVAHASVRCLEMWHSLQGLAGVRNSYARRALHESAADAPAAPPAASAAAVPAVAAPATPDAPVGPAAPAAAGATSVDAPPAAAANEAAKESGDPWIDSSRCTSCNECINLNGRMFAYDANQQAYIKDASAGSYRELVEAAENCQVAIIHPGTPRDAGEPGLEELLERAQPFA